VKPAIDVRVVLAALDERSEFVVSNEEIGRLRVRIAERSRDLPISLCILSLGAALASERHSEEVGKHRTDGGEVRVRLFRHLERREVVMQEEIHARFDFGPAIVDSMALSTSGCGRRRCFPYAP
jgi:hypothetical protein